jgi:predicted O-methyltransferase YrrM
MKLVEARQYANATQGWLTDDEGKVLHAMAEFNRQGLTVEIGSWKGKSTIYLAAGAEENKYGINRVVAIDHFKGSSEHQGNGPVDTLADFKRNLNAAGLAANVRAMVMTSLMAVRTFHDRSVGAIFIDGAHEYEAVKQDFDLWWPKIAPGGVIALHDTGPPGEFPGPIRVMQEELLTRPDRIERWERVDSLFIAWKVI